MPTSGRPARPRGTAAAFVFLVVSAIVAAAAGVSRPEPLGRGVVSTTALGASLVEATILGLVLVFCTRRRWRPAIVDDWLDNAAERFHDGLAWMLGRRKSITTAAVAGVFALSLQAATRNGARDDARITFDVLGPDSQTLAGVASRIADEMRAVPGVVRALTSADSAIANGRLAPIERVDGQRVVRVHALVSGRPFGDTRSDISAKIATTPLPPGYEASEQRAASSAAFPTRATIVAFGAALTVTLLVLTIQFRSLVEPLVIASSVLLSISGVTVVLMASGHSPTSGTALGGALTIALTVSSTTTLLGRARRRRAPGAPARVAIIEATRRQFTPVVLSTVVLTGAMLPIVLGETSGDVTSLGTVVLLGGVVSAIVTLVVTPPLTATFEDFAGRAREWRAQRRV